MRRVVAVGLSLLVAACGAKAGTDQGTPDAGLVAGQSGSVNVFTQEHITGGHRDAEATVTLPPPGGLFSKVTLKWKLSCPPAGCDPWDRIAELHVVNDDGSTVEVARLITPYGVGATWEYDVTALQPVLTGTRKFQLHVDTWVDGWMNDISLDYEGGIPSPVPVEVKTLWRAANVVYGDPDRPPEAAFPSQSIERQENETLQVRVILTGHGQGNRSNCAEFCPKTHSVVVGGAEQPLDLWRDDCGQNPVSKQLGNWQPSRAGWCPGADVRPFVLDVTDAVPAGQSTPVSMAFEEYENTCRPGASETGVCKGCGAGTDCNYNDSGHTEPFYDTSVQLIRFR